MHRRGARFALGAGRFHSPRQMAVGVGWSELVSGAEWPLSYGSCSCNASTPERHEPQHGSAHEQMGSEKADDALVIARFRGQVRMPTSSDDPQLLRLPGLRVEGAALVDPDYLVVFAMDDEKRRWRDVLARSRCAQTWLGIERCPGDCGPACAPKLKRWSPRACRPPC